MRIAHFSFADGLQDQASQYFFQYLFLLFMISLIFRQACAELKLKNGEKEKVRHAMGGSEIASPQTSCGVRLSRIRGGETNA